MKTLRDFLLAEAKKQKKEKRQPPEGYGKASIAGGITKEGLQILQRLSGVDDDGEEVSYGDIMKKIQEPQKIKDNFGVSSIGSLRDLMGKKGIFSQSEGGKRMQEIFLESAAASRFIRGEGGYRIKLKSGWNTLARTEPSSQKVIMFWVNTLYNVYILGTNVQSKKEDLIYFFSEDKKYMIVDEK